MFKINMEPWLLLAIAATICFVPAWLAIGLFSKHFGVRASTFIIWYLPGIALMAAAYVAYTTHQGGGSIATAIAPSWGVVVAIFLVGMTIGAGVNIFLFNAVEQAPNPGLPVAVSSLSTAMVFLLAPLLYSLKAEWFEKAEIDWWGFFGVMLTVIGSILIAVGKNLGNWLQNQFT